MLADVLLQLMLSRIETLSLSFFDLPSHVALLSSALQVCADTQRSPVLSTFEDKSSIQVRPWRESRGGLKEPTPCGAL